MPTRVVLVDDHVMVREGMRALLEREGFAVVGEASNGMQAVQLAKELRPEVVIRDVQAGAVYLGQGTGNAVVEAYLSGATEPTDPLTARERQVLQLVAEGRTTKEIARLLG